ncbi:hypothetical protein [Halalkalibacillus sediminis]|uniref:hypothetical protein n=1 Tax=Halalkalibacillus sediminis TaxID=2018042 RepID=UPI00138FEC52|nr:hypothetical protein [Halalkalibacillus sediminis]
MFQNELVLQSMVQDRHSSLREEANRHRYQKELLKPKKAVETDHSQVKVKNGHLVNCYS